MQQQVLRCVHAWSDMHGPPRKWRSRELAGDGTIGTMGGEYRPLVHGGDPDTHTSLEPP
jgi:hypothetical protein